MSNDKWNEEEIATHINANCDYGSAIVIAALYKKLYGKFPKIGLSGFQGEAAESVLAKLPETTPTGARDE